VDDVTLRKSPYWQQMFSIRNVRKIMNDHDVIATKGKESLKRLHANALALLELTYTRDDLVLLLEDARRGLEQKSISQIQESLDLFLELLGFQLVSLEVLEPGFQSFARPKPNGGVVPTFEHLILFDEENLSLGLKKGAFSPQSDSDLGWVMRYARGEETVEHSQDADVGQPSRPSPAKGKADISYLISCPLSHALSIALSRLFLRTTYRFFGLQLRSLLAALSR
jgi:hypothetical protein